jgi:hypothetical protein
MCCCQCSKPLTYGIALDQLGCDMVHQYVGQEPSGRNFNELVLDYNSEWAYMPCVMSFRCGLHCNLSYDRFIFVPSRQWFKSTFSPCISSNTYILCIYYLNAFVGLKISTTYPSRCYTFPLVYFQVFPTIHLSTLFTPTLIEITFASERRCRLVASVTVLKCNVTVHRIKQAYNVIACTIHKASFCGIHLL